MYKNTRLAFSLMVHQSWLVPYYEAVFGAVTSGKTFFKPENMANLLLLLTTKFIGSFSKGCMGYVGFFNTTHSGPTLTSDIHYFTRDQTKALNDRSDGGCGSASICFL